MPLCLDAVYAPFQYSYSTLGAVVNYAASLSSLAWRSKMCGLMSFCVTALYGYLSWYEFHNLTKLIEEWRGYRRVFSIYAAQKSISKVCAPISTFSYLTCPVIGDADLLNDAISRGEGAFGKHLLIFYLKPISLQIAKTILTYSLQKELINKWLGSRNNQLGLKVIDNETADESRKTIGSYSALYIGGMLERLSIVPDIITALGKVLAVYNANNNLNKEGLSFNLFSFTALAFCTYVVVNGSLSYLSKKQNAKSLDSTRMFEDNLYFNAQNALQVEVTQATKKENILLKEMLISSTKANSYEYVLNTSINLASSMLTNGLGFIILRKAVPSILFNPTLYFSLEKIADLVVQVCSSSWDIFAKISNTNSTFFAGEKVNRFINSITTYEKLLAANKGFKINYKDKIESLSVALDIYYPASHDKLEEKGMLQTQQLLIPNLRKEFKPGTITAISGKSGSGKSSFFNALVGINPFVRGLVNVCAPKNVIYIPQKPVFKPNQSWMDTILYPLTEGELNTMDCRYEVGKAISDLVNELDLKIIYEKSKTLSHWSGGLSGGEAQRVALIQALARIYLYKAVTPGDSIVLLLDESFNAMDYKLKEVAFSVLTREVKANNVIALSIDHSEPQKLYELYGEENIIDFNKLKPQVSKELTKHKTSGLKEHSL